MERLLVAEVRKSIQEAIDWDCEVVRHFATTNRGVYGNIALGARFVFEREEVAIFLEDDNLPEPTFFAYCSELLELYKNDTRVLWVCGTNYLGRYEPEDQASYMFTKHLLPCGWASWRDKFNEFYDYDLHSLSSQQWVDRTRFEYEDRRLYSQQLSSVRMEQRQSARGTNYSSWDHHMAWSIRANGLFGISPALNQIKNIGVDEFSEHGGTSFDMIMTRRFCGMESYPISKPLVHPPAVLVDRAYEKRTGRIILLPLRVRTLILARRLLGRMFSLPPDFSISRHLKSRIRRGSSAE